MATYSSSTPETGTVISASRKRGYIWASLRLFSRKGIDPNESQQRPEREGGEQGANAIDDGQKMLAHAPRDETYHEYEFDQVGKEDFDAESKDNSTNWHEILPSSSAFTPENTSKHIDKMENDDVMDRHIEQESDHLRGIVGTTVVCSQLLDDTGVSSELESSGTESELSLHPSMIGSSVIEHSSNEGDDGASDGRDHIAKARTHAPLTADVKDEWGCLDENAALAGEKGSSSHVKEMPLHPDSTETKQLESSGTESDLSLHPSMIGSSVIEPSSNEGDDGASGGRDHIAKARTHAPLIADVKDEWGCLAVNAALAGEKGSSSHVKEMPLHPDLTETKKNSVEHDPTKGTSKTGDQDHTPDSFLKVGMRLRSPQSSQRAGLSSDGDLSWSNRGDASRKNLSAENQRDNISQSPGVEGNSFEQKRVVGFLIGSLLILMYTKYLMNSTRIPGRSWSEHPQITATQMNTETDQKDPKYFKSMDDSESMGAEPNHENGNDASDTVLQLCENYSTAAYSPPEKVLLKIEGNPAYLLTTLHELSFPSNKADFFGNVSYSIASSINNQEGSQMKQLMLPLTPEAHVDAETGESGLEAGRKTSTPWFPDLFRFFGGIEYSALALLFIWCLCSYEKRMSKAYPAGGWTAAARRVGSHPGKVSVGVLKVELRKRNFPVSASKSDLIGRLQKSNLHHLNSVSWEALKVELRAKGIKVQGRRVDLVDRLQKVERDALECLKVTEIQDKLRENGLPVSVLKSDLIDRLRASIRADLDAQEVATLRDRLRRRGLSSSGKRAQLIERLERVEYHDIFSC